VDDNGNVYIASGQVYVYNSKGEMIDRSRFQSGPRNCYSEAAIAVLCSCWA